MSGTPDFPQTRLALRCWTLDQARMMVRSLNDPGQKGSWVGRAMAGPEGGWPHDGILTATCALAAKPRRKKNKDDDAPPPHGPIPAPDCTCGIYATTDLLVINDYLSAAAPVLGVVELGGRIIPAEQGYRAAAARIAVILLPDPALTVARGVLEDLAAAYRIPALEPHSTTAEAYREAAGQLSVGAEAEAWLAGEGDQ